jgi:hypothetical protein
MRVLRGGGFCKNKRDGEHAPPVYHTATLTVVNIIVPRFRYYAVSSGTANYETNPVYCKVVPAGMYH